MYGCYMIEADPESWLKYAVRVFLSKAFYYIIHLDSVNLCAS